MIAYAILSVAGFLVLAVIVNLIEQGVFVAYFGWLIKLILMLVPCLALGIVFGPAGLITSGVILCVMLAYPKFNRWRERQEAIAHISSERQKTIDRILQRMDERL